MITYFAYGSNIHPRRLVKRVDAVQNMGAYSIQGYALTFNKRGADLSAKCNLRESPSGRVLGVCYRLTPDQWDLLASAEPGYRICDLALSSGLSARTFIADEEFVDEDLAPFAWYRDIVVCGMEYFVFPQYHLRGAKKISVVDDDQQDRAAAMEGELELMLLLNAELTDVQQSHCRGDGALPVELKVATLTRKGERVEGL